MTTPRNGTSHEDVLAQVVDQLCAASAEPNRAGGRLVLPSRDVVLQCVEGLRQALFPGYFGATDLHDKSLHYYVGAILDRVFHQLGEQVARAVAFVDGHDVATCDHCRQRADQATVTLLAELPELRRASRLGAATFAAFSAFWTTLAFHLATPRFGLGSGAAGLFGLIGASGALAAPVVGRLADRRGARWASGVALGLALLAFAVLAVGGGWLLGLVAGVLLLDVGAQANQVANLARVHALRPEARSRLNTVYMVTYFGGGAIGTWAGAHAWASWGWTGVWATGGVFVVLGLLSWALEPRR